MWWTAVDPRPFHSGILGEHTIEGVNKISLALRVPARLGHPFLPDIFVLPFYMIQTGHKCLFLLLSPGLQRKLLFHPVLDDTQQ